MIANLQFNPLIATPILRLLELDYLLFRLGGLLVVCSLLFLGGSVGFVVESLGVLTAGRRRYIAAAACVLACAFLGDMWGRQHLYEANWRRDYFSYLTGAARPWPSYSNLDELRALLSEHVAVGSVVLTPARLANYLPAAHAVFVVATPLEHTNYSVPDADSSLRDLFSLFEPLPGDGAAREAVMETKRRLLCQYGVGFVLETVDAPRPETFLPIPSTAEIETSGDFLLVRLDQPCDPSVATAGRAPE